MKRKKRKGLPQGPLREAIEIVPNEENDNLCLHVKLENELTKPLYEEIRSAETDAARIDKLKAPQGLGAVDFMKAD